MHMKAFPGLRCESMESKRENGKVFLFKGTDFIQYVRKETNELKHLLYAYKIYL